MSSSSDALVWTGYLDQHSYELKVPLRLLPPWSVGWAKQMVLSFKRWCVPTRAIVSIDIFGVCVQLVVKHSSWGKKKAAVLFSSLIYSYSTQLVRVASSTGFLPYSDETSLSCRSSDCNNLSELSSETHTSPWTSSITPELIVVQALCFYPAPSAEERKWTIVLRENTPQLTFAGIGVHACQNVIFDTFSWSSGMPLWPEFPNAKMSAYASSWSSSTPNAKSVIRVRRRYPHLPQ